MGCSTVSGVLEGSPPPPPPVDPNPGGRQVGRSATGLPVRGGGAVGTPTYIPQNDPHDALIILNIHKWGKQNFPKKCARKLRLPSAKVRPGGRIGVKMFSCVFHPFLNAPQNPEYFEYRHIGQNKKVPPAVCLKQNLRHLWRPQHPLIHTTIFLGGSVDGGGGGGGAWGLVLAGTPRGLQSPVLTNCMKSSAPFT